LVIWRATVDEDGHYVFAVALVAVGRCPQSGAPLASQSTISRLENAPSKTEAARLCAALLDPDAVVVQALIGGARAQAVALDPE
jgi:hypothetical protein